MSNVAHLDEARQTRAPSGRTPPHDLNAERCLLGAALNRNDVIDEAADLITPDDFYQPAHGHIWAALLQLRAEGHRADPITLAARLQTDGLLDAVGGPTIGTTLQEVAPHTGWGGWGQIIHDRATRRRMLGAAGEVAEAAYDLTRPLPATIDHAQSAMFAIDDRRARSGPAAIADGIDDYLSEIDARIDRRRQGSTITGITWGLDGLNNMTLGAHPGQLIIIGGRPGTGKTSLLLGVAIAAAETSAVTLFASLEMSIDELRDRYMAAQAIISLASLRSGSISDVDRDVIGGWADHSRGLPLVIDDEPARTVAGIASVARRTKAKYGRLDMIIVDYLQLVTAEKDTNNRANDVAAMSRGLKILARQLEVPVITGSQLSRNLESRLDKRPMLSDLRESGGLEQDADIVAFTYREHLYYPDKADERDAEIIVAKQRNGPTGTVRVVWDKTTTRFMDIGSKHNRHADEGDQI